MCCYKALNAQKRENGGIVSNFDAIWGYWGPTPAKFEKVKFGQNLWLKDVLYVVETLLL